MLSRTLSTGVGFVILLIVVFVSVLERSQGEIHYFDWHAGVVVLGGVLGSLLMALEGSKLRLMASDWMRVIFGQDTLRRESVNLRRDMQTITKAWKEGRRAEILDLAEKHPSEEIRVASESLIGHLQGAALVERFEYLRAECSNALLPQIEGWDLVARLSPSFGIVGTVAGMVHLFRNMGNNSGNLGGAMGLALLATLYGILLGTAVGGPMSTRLNQVLNDRLSVIDLLERQVAALVEADGGRSRKAESHS